MTSAAETLTCDFQPYGKFTISIDHHGDYKGHPLVEGVVIEGTETSRLFQFTATRSIKGERRTIYGITPEELAAGRCVRVAM